MKVAFLMLLVVLFSFKSFAGIGAIINGDTSICVGQPMFMFDTTAGGIWKISDTDIASIDSVSGVVIGLSNGTAIVTYEVGTAYVTTTITVNSSPAPIIGPRGVCVGSEITLYDTTPGGGYWSCVNYLQFRINTSTLDSVSIVGLTCCYDNLIFTDNLGCSTELNIAVFPLPPSITGVTNIFVDSTTTLSDAYTGGRWSSSDTAIATVGSATGIVTGISPGTTTIYYYAGCTTSASLTVFRPTSIPNLPTTGNNCISIFPNPTTDKFTIKTSVNAYTCFTITSTLGQLMLQQQLNTAITQVDVSALPSGVYYISFSSKSDKEVRKFVKM